MEIVIHQNNNLIDFKYFDDGVIIFSFRLYIPNSKLVINDSLITIAYFSRPFNSDYYNFNLSISEELFSHAQYRFKANLKSFNISSSETAIKPYLIKNTPKLYLAFSGGFDSLAVYILINDICEKIISIDYGGNFNREYEYFSRFNVDIFRSNIRESYVSTKVIEEKKRFNENLSWEFMFSPLLSYKEIATDMAIVGGTIMEASPFWFGGEGMKKSFDFYSSVFMPGVAYICPLACLTEYGTTKIVVQSLSQSEVNLALDSLAAKNSFKRYRKQVLIDLVSGINPIDRPYAIKKYKFGGSFADDAVALYVIFKCGKKWALDNYLENIPPNSELINMSFFEKINSNILNGIAPDLRETILSRLQKFSMNEYEPSDYINLESARNYIINFKK